MTKKEKFLLVSLSESKSKELAQAISNESCRKILDYLADKEATETELAEKLQIPISTVHYNLQQLQKGNLVIAEEFHYSEKGKEVNHYKLTNKYIIIAPKSTYGIKEKLRSILPVITIIAITGAVIQFVSRLFSGSVNKLAAARDIQPLLQEESVDAAVAASSAFTNTSTTITMNPPSALANIALWFFIGAALALSLYLIIDWFRNKD